MDFLQRKGGKFKTSCLFWKLTKCLSVLEICAFDQMNSNLSYTAHLWFTSTFYNFPSRMDLLERKFLIAFISTVVLYPGGNAS